MELAQHPEWILPDSRNHNLAQTLIIDDAELLSAQGHENVHDNFDRPGISLFLIGMPRLQRRLERFPQFYSRFAFVHLYRTLEMRRADLCAYPSLAETRLATERCRRRGSPVEASVLLHRLFVQIERILKICEMLFIVDEVLEAARPSLVFGAAELQRYRSSQ
jgi:DNA transposition AAA+ family ATPase